MSIDRAVEILQSHAQRLTEGRIALLALLMKSPRAYSLSTIEEQLPVSMNRVTIYRIIQIYEEIGLVVRMVDRKGISVFMFNHEAHRNACKHPHLRCRGCGKVICLPGLPDAYLDTLQQYEIEEVYVIMEGLCPQCLSKNISDED